MAKIVEITPPARQFTLTVNTTELKTIHEALNRDGVNDPYSTSYRLFREIADVLYKDPGDED